MKRTIRTTAGLIRGLGGKKVVSDILGIGSQNIDDWIQSDNIPPGWHLRLFLVGKEKGLTMSPTCFGYPADYGAQVLEMHYCK